MPPKNFAAYRQSELDNQRISSFSAVQQIPFIANRFALKRFLGLSEEDMAENERLWREENDEELDKKTGDAAGEMRGAGISGAGISSDVAGAEDTADLDNMEDGGDAGAVDSAAGDDAMGGGGDPGAAAEMGMGPPPA